MLLVIFITFVALVFGFMLGYYFCYWDSSNDDENREDYD